MFNKKIFIILPVAYEYSDEYYYQCGNNSEHFEQPKNEHGFFFNEATAVEECRRLNEEERKTVSFEDYSVESFEDLEKLDFYKVFEISLSEKEKMNYD